MECDTIGAVESEPVSGTVSGDYSAACGTRKRMKESTGPHLPFFIRSLFESALKINPYLEFAVLMGCLRISKESISTDALPEPFWTNTSSNTIVRGRGGIYL